MNNHRQIWNEFCTTNNIATNKVPLFETSSNLAVKTKQIGKPEFVGGAAKFSGAAGENG
jgi:hypothetical protein